MIGHVVTVDLTQLAIGSVWAIIADKWAYTRTDDDEVDDDESIKLMFAHTYGDKQSSASRHCYCAITVFF